jgi:hypothetical protein
MIQAMFKTDVFESLINLLAYFKALAPLDFQGKRYIFVDGAPLQQLEILENNAEVAAKVRNAGSSVTGNIAAIDQNLATAGSLRTVEQFQQG